jgi:probable FeS assembly SUF system protein SufT
MPDTITLKRDCEAIAVPSGSREVLPAGTTVRVVQARGDSYTVSNSIHAIFRIDGRDADALGMQPPAATPQGEQNATLSEDLVWKALKNVYDPELPVNIVDLGLVYSCAITEAAAGGKLVAIRMGVTAPGCGMSNVLRGDVETKVRRLPQVAETDVQVVFDPPWSPARMSDAARLQLGFDLEGGGPQLTQIGPIR